MKQVRIFSAGPALTATSLACVLLAGCYTWRPAELPLHELVSEGRTKVKVYDRAGDDHTLAGPRVEGDTLVGSPGLFRTKRIPLEDIDSVEVQEIDWLGTGLGTLGMVTLALLVPRIWVGSE